MLRNSIVYRRLWYVKKRNTRKIQILFRISAAIIILSLIATSFTGRLLPGLQNYAGQMIKSHISQIISENVMDVFPGSLVYDDVVITNRNADSSQDLIELNMVRLNMLSEALAGRLAEKLKIADYQMFKMQKLFNIEIQQMGNIETTYISEFSEVDINRTKHSIYLKVRIDISYKGSLLDGSTTVISIFPVAEAYISGNAIKKTAE